MAFAEDKAVSIRPGGVLGVMVHALEIEGGKDVYFRKGPPGMAAPGGEDHLDYIPSQFSGNGLKFIYAISPHLITLKQ
jgi:hypothetical protein